MGAFTIDTSEQFQHLDKAPIVEAVIELKGIPTRPWSEDLLLKTLDDALPDYQASERGVKATIGVTQKISPEEHSISTEQHSEWTGFRFRHKTQQSYLAQFERTGFLLSRIAPYENWETFVCEALRLWNLYQKAVDIKEIQRIGVRFLNLIQIPLQSSLLDYLRRAPIPPEGLELPYLGFLHSDILKVPDSPYVVTTNTTIQPDPKGEPFVGLIVDVDVFTDRPLSNDEAEIRRWLDEMRWLKNKAFFGTLTEDRIKELK
jgi:uncharacterized protein (TIGR04255 family)